MRHLILTISALLAIASLSCSKQSNAAVETSRSTWIHDFEAAKSQAKLENKTIFLYFTGSDWCTWCKKMEKDILTQKEFLDYAEQNLVLVELDYPRKEENKAKQSEAERAQNKALDKKFKIEGYPTIYLTDASGEPIPGGDDFAKEEYTKEGPSGMVAALKKFLAEK